MRRGRRAARWPRHPYFDAKERLMNKATQEKLIFKALDNFQIELPSWGFADTGTRFGKFFQPAAAIDLEDKLHDAGLVHKLTAACPTVAVHVLWDFKPGVDPRATAKIAKKHGIKIGAINPNVFQDQAYKLGSFCSPDKKAQQMAVAHTLDSVEIGKAVGSNLLSMWLADGTNYPGQDSILRRWADLKGHFKKIHDKMPRGMKMLVEYKPFEPAFYHTDIPDWGAAYLLAKHSGKNAQVLVDTGHHLPGTNIEHIVSLLLDENMLGGFHFNDKKYADDDLTMSSIDPYATFRIFDQIEQFMFDKGKDPKLAYMVDQCHNLKPKLEAMIQTVMMAQELYAKAAIVDRKALAIAQKNGNVVDGERTLRDAYDTDVRPVVAKWRKSKGVAADPIAQIRKDGVIEALGKLRTQKRKDLGMLQSAVKEF
jgi:L-rhamnose isomerase/sugar isomerase